LDRSIVVLSVAKDVLMGEEKEGACTSAVWKPLDLQGHIDEDTRKHYLQVYIGDVKQLSVS